MAIAEVAKRWCGEALQRGVLMLAGGPEGRVAQVVPPLMISEEQLEAVVISLENVLVEERK